MVWTLLGIAGNAVITVAYLLIAASIAVPLARTGQLRTNRLGLATALIFFSCAAGHGLHVEHLLIALQEGTASSLLVDGHTALVDLGSAFIGTYYWTLRRGYGALVDAGALFDDLRRRQRQLEGEASDAREREAAAEATANAAEERFARAFQATTRRPGPGRRRGARPVAPSPTRAPGTRRVPPCRPRDRHAPGDRPTRPASCGS